MKQPLVCFRVLFFGFFISSYSHFFSFLFILVFISSCFRYVSFSFFLVFIFSCFHFLMLLFLQMFSLLIAFVYFIVSSLLLLLRVLRIWESAFYSKVFFKLLPCFYQGLRGAGSSVFKVIGLPLEVRNRDLDHLFVWITQYSAIIW